MRWSSEQDRILRERILALSGRVNWAATECPTFSVLSKAVKCLPGFSYKQCRERWLHKLNPGINFRPWTAAEVLKLFNLKESHGSQWSVIAAALPGRTALQARNQFNSQLQCMSVRGAIRLSAVEPPVGGVTEHGRSSITADPHPQCDELLESTASATHISYEDNTVRATQLAAACAAAAAGIVLGSGVYAGSHQQTPILLTATPTQLPVCSDVDTPPACFDKPSCLVPDKPTSPSCVLPSVLQKYPKQHSRRSRGALPCLDAGVGDALGPSAAAIGAAAGSRDFAGVSSEGPGDSDSSGMPTRVTVLTGRKRRLSKSYTASASATLASRYGAGHAGKGAESIAISTACLRSVHMPRAVSCQDECSRLLPVMDPSPVVAEAGRRIDGLSMDTIDTNACPALLQYQRLQHSPSQSLSSSTFASDDDDTTPA